MASNLTKEEEFTQAACNWNLEKLYLDLGSIKGKALTPVEKRLLRGLLCSYSPAEIANILYQSRSSSTVRVYLSNGLYKYIEEMLSGQTGTPVKVQNWSRVTHLLEKAGYKRDLYARQVSIIPHTNNSVNPNTQHLNWGEAIDVSVFYGRTQELTQLEKWIVLERCRLVAILGMGGIGKTALSVKLASQIQQQFEYVIWRSLKHSPLIESILTQLLSILSPQDTASLPLNADGMISQLLECLRSSRCLIVLDNVESILCSGDRQSSYRQGYEAYGELIKRIGDSHHQSCLLLTSREKTKEIVALQGDTLPVRALKLSGLTNLEGWEILKAKGLAASSEEWQLLVECYGGNPLFLKIIATIIQDLFDGKISELFEQGTVIFSEIREILDRQFNRLSYIETQIMYWLSLNPEFNSLRKLQKDILQRISQREILEAVQSLQRRSLIQKTTSGFTQERVVMEYIIERLIEQVFKKIDKQEVALLLSNTMIESQIKNYIRENRLSADISSWAIA